MTLVFYQPLCGVAQQIGKGSVGVRIAPAYPGERTGNSVKPKETFLCVGTATVEHTHTDCKSYTITCFELADGRGWVHDFDSGAPGPRTITVLDTPSSRSHASSSPSPASKGSLSRGGVHR